MPGGLNGWREGISICPVDRGNSTSDTGFALLGFSDLPHFRIPIFVGFLFIYGTTFLGNLLILVLATLDPQLQTPMYFFLRNLSLVEFCYSSVILPKILRDLSTGDGYISLLGCAFQMFLFCFLGTTECFLLGVMAYDRYAAICQPLRYSLLLTWDSCLKFTILSWTGSFLMSVIQPGWIFSLSYCGSRIIQHYFCEFLPLLDLSYSDTRWITIELVIYDTMAAVIPFFLILLSYTRIVITIFHLHHAERHKAFSTCSSHLLCVSLFYSSGMVSYMIPKSLLPITVQRVASLFYTIFIPMLNPFIYGLRNSDVKGAFRKLLGGKLFKC
ncbi:hypothetical protein FKM82_005241 [Ascaphus truei]